MEINTHVYKVRLHGAQFFKHVAKTRKSIQCSHPVIDIYCPIVKKLQ